MTKNVVLLFILIAYGCAQKKCFENSPLYLHLVKLYKADTKLLNQAGKEDLLAYKEDAMLRDSIFSNICGEVNSARSIIFIRELTLISGKQKGLIYFPEINRTFYYVKKFNSKIEFGKDDSNFDRMEKVFDIVKKDFRNQGPKLKSFFDRTQFFDAPYLEIAFVDVSKDGRDDKLIGFSFGANMGDEFDEQFKIEQVHN